MEKVLSEIKAERKRQDDKWGIQSHHDFYWSLIVGEEYGEICKELVDHPVATDKNHLRNEIIQLASVCVAWVECLDRLEDQNEQCNSAKS